ncbi:MAG: ABC transporter permease [Anaerolineae bacterium]|nr:ABC transporter permease [Anaerolineae bacterium]
MKQFGQSRTVALLVTPALAFLVLLFILPLLFVLLGTVQDDAGALTVQPYLDFVQDPVVHLVFGRTLRLALVVTVIAAVVSYPAAYAIARMKRGRRSVMMSLIILPLMTNPVARTYSWLVILGRNGLISNMLESLNLVERAPRMLYTETAIVLGLLHLFLPLMILSLVSAMENIRPELEEAAHSLGANRLTVFLRVIIPLSADGLILGGTLVFTGCITAYVTPAILGGTRVLMLATLLYQRAMVLLNWDSATVVAVAMVITTLIVNRLLRFFRPKTL